MVVVILRRENVSDDNSREFFGRRGFVGNHRRDSRLLHRDPRCYWFVEIKTYCILGVQLRDGDHRLLGPIGTVIVALPRPHSATFSVRHRNQSP